MIMKMTGEVIRTQHLHGWTLILAFTQEQQLGTYNGYCMKYLLLKRTTKASTQTESTENLIVLCNVVIYKSQCVMFFITLKQTC